MIRSVDFRARSRQDPQQGVLQPGSAQAGEIVLFSELTARRRPAGERPELTGIARSAGGEEAQDKDPLPGVLGFVETPDGFSVRFKYPLPINELRPRLLEAFNEAKDIIDSVVATYGPKWLLSGRQRIYEYGQKNKGIGLEDQLVSNDGFFIKLERPGVVTIGLRSPEINTPSRHALAKRIITEIASDAAATSVTVDFW